MSEIRKASLTDMPLVLIHWLDSSGGSGWNFESEIDTEAPLIKTIGWVFHETDDRITIISNHGREQALCSITIPKCSIKERQELGKPHAEGCGEIICWREGCDNDVAEGSDYCPKCAGAGS